MNDQTRKAMKAWERATDAEDSAWKNYQKVSGKPGTSQAAKDKAMSRYRAAMNRRQKAWEHYERLKNAPEKKHANSRKRSLFGG